MRLSECGVPLAAPPVCAHTSVCFQYRIQQAEGDPPPPGWACGGGEPFKLGGWLESEQMRTLGL